MGDILRRTLKNGRTAFYARYIEADGKRTSKATKARTEEDALKVLYAIEARVRAGQVGLAAPTKEEREERRQKQEAEQKRASLTLKELGEKFSTEYANPRIKSIERYRGEAKTNLKSRIVPYLGAMAAQSVTTADVERMRDELANRGASPAAMVQAMAILSKIYNWGHKRGFVQCANPVRGVDRPRVEASLDFLSREEVGNLLAHTVEHAPDVHPMLACAIYAGLRKGELFGLRWRDVHSEAGRMDVERSYRERPKSGKVRHIPIHPELAVILRQWKETCPKTSEGLVFPVNGKMGTAFKSLGLGTMLETSGCHVPKKPWHSLRHTFASHFMMAGGNILTLQKLLGHSDLRMTLIYAHLSPDFMAAEVARMSFTQTIAGVADMSAARRLRAVDTERETEGKEADTEESESANSSAISTVPRDGIEPPTRGFSVR
jgi:integrase